MISKNGFLGYMKNKNISILIVFFFFFVTFSQGRGAIIGFNQCPASSSLYEVFLMSLIIYFSYLRLPPLEVFTHRSVLDASMRFSSRCIFFSLYFLYLIIWMDWEHLCYQSHPYFVPSLLH
jgi:hypothetical protein